MISEALVIQHVGVTFQRPHRYMIMTIEEYLDKPYWVIDILPKDPAILVSSVNHMTKMN